MTRAGFSLLLGALLAFPWAVGSAQGQTADRWQLTLESGDYVWDIHLVRLEGDRIVFRQSDTLGTVPVAKVTEIRRIGKTEVRMAEGAGAGGAIGALTGADDEVFDLASLDYAARLRTVQQIFLMHPPDDSGKQ